MTQYYFNRYISDHRSVAEVHHITCVESESIKIKQILDYYLSISNYRIEDCVIQMPKVFFKSQMGRESWLYSHTKY